MAPGVPMAHPHSGTVHCAPVRSLWCTTTTHPRVLPVRPLWCPGCTSATVWGAHLPGMTGWRGVQAVYIQAPSRVCNGLGDASGTPWVSRGPPWHPVCRNAYGAPWQGGVGRQGEGTRWSLGEERFSPFSLHWGWNPEFQPFQECSFPKPGNTSTEYGAPRLYGALLPSNGAGAPSSSPPAKNANFPRLQSP